MDLISNLGAGFAGILDPVLLLTLLIGVAVGSVVGVLPGVGPVGAMAILLPLTFTLDPAAGILMTAGIYLGSQYGGSTSSILVGVPGEPSSVVAIMDGYPMAKTGRAGAALAIAAIGSFVAGTLALVLITLLAQPLSRVAIEFASPEFMLIALFALIALSRLAGGSTIRTFVAVAMGLMLATVGLDSSSGAVRFDLGIQPFLEGITISAVAVGLFGIPELLLMWEEGNEVRAMPKIPFRSLLPTRDDLRRSALPMVRGGLLGFLLGLIPGPSGLVSAYGSYAIEKRLSKHKDEFGSGAIEGVAGPESANNGSSGGAMVPLLILGLPFNGPTALLLAAFTIHGVIPGPLFVQNDPQLFWTLIAGLYAANVALLVLNLPLVGLFTSLLRVPRDLLIAFVVMVSIIGVYATRGQIIDVFWLVAMSVLGYLLAKLGISRVAVMLAFVIGPFLESSLKQTVVLARGDIGYLFGRPISVGIMTLTVLIVCIPPVARWLAGRLNLRPAVPLEGGS